jgi:uroporphyrinogen-III synthase
MSTLKIKNVLISQPQPENDKSPYSELEKQHNVEIVFRKLIRVERIDVREFRKLKINLASFTALIFTSKNAIDHFFSLAEELRYSVPDSMKYFCTTEAIALYLQKYVQFRKRKIFFGNNNFSDLGDVIKKHKDEKYLFICAEVHQCDIPNFLDKQKVSYAIAPIYRTVSEDVSDLDINSFQMTVFFSPFGIKSLKENKPDYEQGDTIFGAFGEKTARAIEEAGFKLHVKAPSPEFPSMAMAMQDFFQKPKK